jgi:pilus assembly protein FimV
MSQQARKEQEGIVVRRLTAGAGATALGLAWYFTASATTAAPIAFGAQPAPEQPVVGMEQLDDHVFVRTVHVPAPQPSIGGVRSASGGVAGGSIATARTSSGGVASAPAANGSAPVAVAQPVPAAAPAPVATPKPVAATGASTVPK